MRIAVLVKEVPDTYGDRVLDPETGLADRGASDPVLDEIGERALEVALSRADAGEGVEVVLVSMGPESAAVSIRKGLAMGADRAVQVADPALAGADLLLTSEALAAALRRVEPDVVIAGNQSTDGSGGVVPAMLAERLGMPLLSGLAEVEIADSGVSGSRPVDGGVQRVSAGLPAVISITEALPEGRFPNFKGIMAAKKKPFETLSLADLGIDAGSIEGRVSSIMLEVAARPPRAAGVKIVDEGDAGERLAEFLVQNRLA